MTLLLQVMVERLSCAFCSRNKQPVDLFLFLCISLRVARLLCYCTTRPGCAYFACEETL